MLLFTYLRRELRHRLRQSILIAVGLAVGIGLVLTVAATAAGVRDAEAKVLASLDTLGTDISVTKTPSAGMSTNSGGGLSIGPQDAGKQIDLLQDADPGSFSPSVLAQLRAVDGVAAVTGELALIDTKMTVPKPGAASLPLPTTILVDGVDPAHADIGTLGQASLASGRGFKAADAQSDVALLDTAYATTNKLKVGSTITLAKKAFKVIGLVHQKADASERVFIPLARAQALSGSKDKLTTAYVAAKSSGEVDAVAKAISKKLSWANVTTSSSLADQISGSLEDTSKLAGNPIPASAPTGGAVAAIIDPIVHGGALVLAGVLGIGLIGMSSKVYEFSQTWVSIAFVLWFLMIGVFFVGLIPAQRAIREGRVAAEQRLAMSYGGMHLLLLLQIIVMVWRPGAPG